MINTAFIRSIREGLRQTRKPKEEGTEELTQEYKGLTPGQTNEDTDKDEPGTQGDGEEYQKKRAVVLKKFGVKSCSELEGDEKKACYAALDAAHVSDDEEDEDDDPVGKNEEVEEARGIRLTPELFKNVKKFGVELEKYAKKSGGIDKDAFMRVAAIAKKGMLPDKSDIPDDTDPRDKVLSMMAGIV